MRGNSSLRIRSMGGRWRSKRRCRRIWPRMLSGLMWRATAMADSARRYELLVFDWDGTLADSTALIAGAIQQACRDMGLAVPDDTTARHVIGLGHRDSIEYVAPELEPHHHAQFTERFG